MSDWVTLKNALDVTIRPVGEWPGKHRYDREAGPFSAPLKDTLATLKRELAALNGKNIVLQVAFRESDLRLDSLPRSGAIASHPGVILTFGSKHGPLRLYFDRFTKWQNNLRAVAMHLEHLRLAGLYGVGTDGQQYKGWQALPDPAEAGFDSADAAASWLLIQAGVSDREGNRTPGTLKSAYREASKRFHPDVGGSHDAFVMLRQAWEVVKAAGLA